MIMTTTNVLTCNFDILASPTDTLRCHADKYSILVSLGKIDGILFIDWQHNT